MWTPANRGRDDRSGLRYPSDLTDAEWAVIAPLIPPGKRGGDKRTVDLREVANALLYVLSTGCQWRAIPKDLPPRSTVHGYFDLWTWDGTITRIHHALYVLCREAVGREASPAAAIIDSQSVKSAEKGGLGPARIRCRQEDQRQEAAHSRRYPRPVDAWPRASCRHPEPAPAKAGDRDGGVLVMATLFGLYPFLLKLYADGGYSGEIFQRGVKKAMAKLNIEIVKCSAQAKGFIVLPKRWTPDRVRGRTHHRSGINRCRRLAKDWECFNRKALSFIHRASIRLMLRKPCNPA